MFAQEAVVVGVAKAVKRARGEPTRVLLGAILSIPHITVLQIGIYDALANTEQEKFNI
jgi:hypothetical protein